MKVYFAKYARRGPSPIEGTDRPATLGVPYADYGDAALSGDTRNKLHYKPLRKVHGPDYHGESDVANHGTPAKTSNDYYGETREENPFDYPEREVIQ